MAKVSAGILDFGYRFQLDSLSAIEQIINYAIEADKIGYTKFWLGEHHYSGSFNQPYTNPDVLIGLIGGMTQRIRLGSAGTLISLYPSYCVATTFKLLANLFPNRIDLGLAKGIVDRRNPLFPFINEVNIQNESKELFNKRLKELHNLLYNEEENFDNHKFAIPPFRGDIPQLWYLSTSYNNYCDAVKYKLNFCRSIFHQSQKSESDYNKKELEDFISNFEKTNGFIPKISLAIAICIEKSKTSAEKRVSESRKIENLNRSEAWKIIPTAINQISKLLSTYSYHFGINEFIIYDFESDAKKKIDNLNNIYNEILRIN